jgi:hypothetical protein
MSLDDENLKFKGGVKAAEDYLRTLIRNARKWAIFSTLFGIIVIGLVFLGMDESSNTAKTLTALGAGAVSGIGLGWALKDIYDFQKKIVHINFLETLFNRKPPPDEKEQVDIKSEFIKTTSSR